MAWWSCINTDSDNGLLPAGHPATTWTCPNDNQTLRNKIQSTLSQNTTFFIDEISSENVICKMSSILFSPSHSPSPVDMLPVTCSFTLAFSFLLKNRPSELSLPFFFGCLCRESWEEFWELSGLGVLWQLSRVLVGGGGNSQCSILGRQC